MTQNEKGNTNELNTIKWALEVVNKSEYKSTVELERAYNIEILGC